MRKNIAELYNFVLKVLKTPANKPLQKNRNVFGNNLKCDSLMISDHVLSKHGIW